jgi:hypothetical protein
VASKYVCGVLRACVWCGESVCVWCGESVCVWCGESVASSPHRRYVSAMSVSMCQSVDSQKCACVSQRQAASKEEKEEKEEKESKEKRGKRVSRTCGVWIFAVSCIRRCTSRGR